MQYYYEEKEIIITGKKGFEVAEQTFLGLPAETWLVVGGLYFIATFLPSVIALILGHREGKKTNE